MQNLFSADHIPPLTLNQDRGELLCFPGWLSTVDSDKYFRLFHQELAWKTETLTMGGKQVQSPRLVALYGNKYGDKDTHYRYSGIRHVALPWHQQLLELREELQRQFSTPANSVLANLYRDGRDSVSWHADAEPELGREPVIYSLSLGCPRLFDYRLKGDPASRRRIELRAGTLLIMRGPFQHYWQHQIPKQLKVTKPRINLTFRYIHQTGQGRREAELGSD